MALQLNVVEPKTIALLSGAVTAGYLLYTLSTSSGSDDVEEYEAIVKRRFPKVEKSSKVEKKVFQALDKLGFTAANTILADSSCADEICHNDANEDISELFRSRWKGQFNLGGLGGLPCTGKTGWAAFSGHVPENGNIVVLITPHVGVDRSGRVGKVLRRGQANLTPTCGAAVGGYCALKKNPHLKDFSNDYQDNQMDTVIHLLKHKLDTFSGICDENEEMVKLAEVMDEICQSYLHDIISFNWMGPDSKLAIISGITVNCDDGTNDMFVPTSFDIHVRDSGGKTMKNSVFKEVFDK